MGLVSVSIPSPDVYVLWNKALGCLYDDGDAGYLLRHRMQQVRYAMMGYFLLSMNLAYLVGFARFLAGRGGVKWQRVP